LVAQAFQPVPVQVRPAGTLNHRLPFPKIVFLKRLASLFDLPFLQTVKNGDSLLRTV
jgi:hypothetical protein